jgi:voltage-dependent calcium channel
MSTQEGENPQSNVESFDAVYYAALQVIIISSANGVSKEGVLSSLLLLTFFSPFSFTVDTSDVQHH